MSQLTRLFSGALAIGSSWIAVACAEEAPPPPAVELNFDILNDGFEPAPSPGSSTPAPAALASGRNRLDPPSDSQKSGLGVTASAEPAASTANPERNGPSAPEVNEALTNGQPRLVATRVATTIYAQPHLTARRFGYIRLGGSVARDSLSVKGTGCRGKWFRIYPQGFVCEDDATTDLASPIARATFRRPALEKPLPYSYGFVRATAPQYLRLPTHAEQKKSEFGLVDHLQWFKDNMSDVQRVELGANDVPLDDRGYARLGLPHPPGYRLSSQRSITELLGGSSSHGEIPFWLKDGRQIPNVSTFQVPDYAIFADRVRRKTGLSFVDAFVAESEGVLRRFAVTVDMRLIPATKVKPDTASPFHGVELNQTLPMPFAFVNRRNATTWKLLKGKDETKPDEPVPRRALIPLSGQVRLKAGQRYYQTARQATRWLKASDLGVVAPPQTLPPEAAAGERWIDVSLLQQTLVLYEGTRPLYATLVSTGKDRLGDPKNSLATPQGSFRIQSKHIAAAMDSDENSSVSGGTKTGRRTGFTGDAKATADRLRAAEKSGKTLSKLDRRRLANIKKGRHPEYGVTMRRGSGNYELRDVPWIQYFAAGYALHGAYWHDVFGHPRSHGCINLAPIDARVVFNFTGPPVPKGWHGLNVSRRFGQGTLVHVRE